MHGNNLCRLQNLWCWTATPCQGSLMKEEMALSWGSWHADSCAATVALRWCLFPFKSLLLLNNTRDRAGNADLWRRRKGTFSPTQACFALTCLPLQWCNSDKAMLAIPAKVSSLPPSPSEGRQGLQHCTSARSACEYVISHPDMPWLLTPALSCGIRHVQSSHSLEAAASSRKMTVFSSLLSCSVSQKGESLFSWTKTH